MVCPSTHGVRVSITKSTHALTRLHSFQSCQLVKRTQSPASVCRSCTKSGWPLKHPSGQKKPLSSTASDRHSRPPAGCTSLTGGQSSLLISITHTSSISGNAQGWGGTNHLAVLYTRARTAMEFEELSDDEAKAAFMQMLRKIYGPVSFLT